MPCSSTLSQEPALLMSIPICVGWSSPGAKNQGGRPSTQFGVLQKLKRPSPQLLSLSRTECIRWLWSTGRLLSNSPSLPTVPAQLGGKKWWLEGLLGLHLDLIAPFMSNPFSSAPVLNYTHGVLIPSGVCILLPLSLRENRPELEAQYVINVTPLLCLMGSLYFLLNNVKLS